MSSKRRLPTETNPKRARTSIGSYMRSAFDDSKDQRYLQSCSLVIAEQASPEKPIVKYSGQVVAATRRGAFSTPKSYITVSQNSDITNEDVVPDSLELEDVQNDASMDSTPTFAISQAASIDSPYQTPVKSGNLSIRTVSSAGSSQVQVDETSNQSAPSTCNTNDQYDEDVVSLSPVFGLPTPHLTMEDESITCSQMTSFFVKPDAPDESTQDAGNNGFRPRFVPIEREPKPGPSNIPPPAGSLAALVAPMQPPASGLCGDVARYRAHARMDNTLWYKKLGSTEEAVMKNLKNALLVKVIKLITTVAGCRVFDVETVVHSPDDIPAKYHMYHKECHQISPVPESSKLCLICWPYLILESSSRSSSQPSIPTIVCPERLIILSTGQLNSMLLE